MFKVIIERAEASLGGGCRRGIFKWLRPGWLTPAYDPNATYEIWDGSTLKGSINVDQTASPNSDAIVDGTSFQNLGDAWVINTGPFRVVLSNYSTDYGYRVMADAVRIIPDAESLSLAVDDSSISEFSGLASATVSRTDTSGDLVVTLSSDDTSEATVPSTVTILDGQSSATFDIAAVDDSEVDGTQQVTISASTAGYNSASINMAKSPIMIAKRSFEFSMMARAALRRVDLLSKPTHRCLGRMTVIITTCRVAVVRRVGPSRVWTMESIRCLRPGPINTPTITTRSMRLSRSPTAAARSWQAPQ